VINYIRRKTAPPHPFIGFEMQAVYSLEAGELYYCEDSPMLGWLYFDEMQSIMNAMLAP
jgi:hypothetical protein